MRNPPNCLYSSYCFIRGHTNHLWCNAWLGKGDSNSFILTDIQPDIVIVKPNKWTILNKLSIILIWALATNLKEHVSKTTFSLIVVLLTCSFRLVANAQIKIMLNLLSIVHLFGLTITISGCMSVKIKLFESPFPSQALHQR